MSTDAGRARHLKAMFCFGVAAVATSLLPAAAGARAGVDVRVTSVKATPSERQPYHHFSDRGQEFELLATIRNVGATPSAPSGRRARRAIVYIHRDGALRFSPQRSELVPPLAPGAPARLGLRASGIEIGDYDTKVCLQNPRTADITGCRRGPSFGVVPRVWEGAVTAKTHPGLAQSVDITSTADVRYRYNANVSENLKRFVYEGFGTIDHSVSGTDASGCTWSGSGNTKIGPGEAALNMATNVLDYRGLIGTQGVFTASIKCGAFASPIPIRTTGLRIGPADRSDSAERTLKGEVAESGAAYSWTLTAG